MDCNHEYVEDTQFRDQFGLVEGPPTCKHCGKDHPSNGEVVEIRLGNDPKRLWTFRWCHKIGSGPILDAPDQHRKWFEAGGPFSGLDPSYAHMYPDGTIKRRHGVIGHRNDVQLVPPSDADAN